MNELQNHPVPPPTPTIDGITQTVLSALYDLGWSDLIVWTMAGLFMAFVFYLWIRNQINKSFSSSAYVGWQSAFNLIAHAVRDIPQLKAGSAPPQFLSLPINFCLNSGQAEIDKLNQSTLELFQRTKRNEEQAIKWRSNYSIIGIIVFALMGYFAAKWLHVSSAEDSLHILHLILPIISVLIIPIITYWYHDRLDDCLVSYALYKNNYENLKQMAFDIKEV